MIKDVEPLLKECEETIKELMQMGNMEAACYVQGFINSINKLPDAEQIPHGEWIREVIFEEPRKNKRAYARCSSCGCYYNHYLVAVKHFDFCPKCGADMRKEGVAE